VTVQAFHVFWSDAAIASGSLTLADFMMFDALGCGVAIATQRSETAPKVGCDKSLIH
jgi:hypothetical protein